MVKPEIIDIVLLAVLPVFAVLLWVLAGYSEKVKNTVWRLCWLAPAFLSFILVYMVGFEKLMIPAYLSALVLIAGLIKPEKRTRRAASVIAAVFALTSVPLCLFNSSYRCVDFVKNFDKGFESMKAHYVLAEHKQVDWEALYEKYLPEFEDADASHDKVANEIAWEKFCAEFHDLHVNYVSDEETMKAAQKRTSGNDYGLVIFTLSDGRTVAEQVDESIVPLGIHNGSEIISWNGMTPAEADELSERKKTENNGDEDNAKFYEGIFAAGVGGDSVEVVFRDDSSAEKTVTLPKISDNYSARLEDAYDTVNQGMNIGHMTIQKISDTIACLRIKTMSFDSISEKDNHVSMQNELREQILALKAEGVRDVIIDIRENNGGSGSMVKAIAQLFAPEGEHYYVSDAYFDKEKQCYVKEADGKWKTCGDVTFEGENILGDEGRVVLLVTAHSVSAADHLTKVMNDFDNTTVIGFTEPSGSAQGVSPIQLDRGTFSYSSSLMLNKDGTVFIDSGTDLQSGNTLDIKIPFDENAVKALFDDGRDYLMDKSLEYLEENNK